MTDPPTGSSVRMGGAVLCGVNIITTADFWDTSPVICASLSLQYC